MFVINRFGAPGAVGSSAEKANGGKGSDGGPTRNNLASGGGGGGAVGWHGMLGRLCVQGTFQG